MTATLARFAKVVELAGLGGLKDVVVLVDVAGDRCLSIDGVLTIGTVLEPCASGAWLCTCCSPDVLAGSSRVVGVGVSLTCNSRDCATGLVSIQRRVRCVEVSLTVLTDMCEVTSAGEAPPPSKVSRRLSSVLSFARAAW